MSKEILVPDIGDFENVEIIEVLVKQGDVIKINDPLVTLESDKSSVEVPSTEEGIIEKLNVKVGDKVSKGDIILFINSQNGENNIKIPPATEKIIEDAPEGMVCIECQNPSVFNEGGCLTCRECGWSKCD